MPLLESPKSVIHAGIYWLTENVTTCMVIFHIGIYLGRFIRKSAKTNKKKTRLTRKSTQEDYAVKIT